MSLEPQAPYLFDLPLTVAPCDSPAGSRPQGALKININEPDDTPWTGQEFAHLPMFGFDLLMYDPPWHFATHSDKGQGKGAAKQYRTWTLRKIKTLPLGQLASRDAVLFLWATSPLLLDVDKPSRSPVGEVIEALGFRYGAFGGWLKKTVNDRDAFGTGYVMRSAMEPFFIATTGSPKHSKACRNIIHGLARGHSRKPESAYRWCERYMPGARRIEICSRTNRKGWDVWGDEVGKFGDARGGRLDEGADACGHPKRQAESESPRASIAPEGA